MRRWRRGHFYSGIGQNYNDKKVAEGGGGSSGPYIIRLEDYGDPTSSDDTTTTWTITDAQAAELVAAYNTYNVILDLGGMAVTLQFFMVDAGSYLMQGYVPESNYIPYVVVSPKLSQLVLGSKTA